MADLTMKELVQTVLNLQKQVAVLNNTCEALKKENECHPLDPSVWVRQKEVLKVNLLEDMNFCRVLVEVI